MNNKGLEEYIREHRKEFDVNLPSDQLWGKISDALDGQKVKKRSGVPLWLGIAASLIVVMGLIFTYTYHNSGNEELRIADINPVYAKKELKFASLIEEKKDSLEVFAKKNPELYAQFSADLTKLGNSYEALKKELQHSPNQKVVVKAMVKNLELQLQVISQQLSIITEVDEYKKENQI